ncbi:MAG: hypothetical protein LC635_02865 [Pseudonocardiaceae bacterium]|nr:hypothetical protein [Pseudonocardiaceae bacterium]
MSTGPPRQLWLLPALLITAIATALGGLLARDLYADPEPGASALAQPPPSSVPPSEQPGPATVQGTADAVAHPLYPTFQNLLQNYFDAINQRDYQRWADTVTSERRTNQPEDKWRLDYGSTKDGSVVLYRIEAADDTARVLLRFTSTQDLVDAPQELPVGCIHWNVVWAFAEQGGEWRLTAGPTSASPQHEAC